MQESPTGSLPGREAPRPEGTGPEAPRPEGTGPEGTARRPRLSRRGLLTGGALTAVGALAACAPEKDASRLPAPGAAAARQVTGEGSPGQGTGRATAVPGGVATEPFHGAHQAGIATAPQTYGIFVGLDLLPDTDREAITRMMRLLTDDALRLTEGRPALADTEPELADLPSRLTVTFGFGPGLFTAAGLEDHRPESVAPLPSFKIDKLRKEWSGGDLLLQICADDALTLSHALRMTVKDARSFAKVRWTQRGFRRSPQTQDPGLTQRNVMGQLDGTVNPKPGTPDFDRAVWVSDGPEWLRGGTTLVLRRIRAEMETWDAVDTVGKEFTVGRRLDTGAPLTGQREHDEADFGKLNATGFPVISEQAHIRRAHVTDPGMRIFRRPYNYDEGLTEQGHSDSGLLFASYQADIARQFIPIQKRLAEADLLNEWTTPIGSAVFAIPPGCSAGGWIGETLLS
ncbi:dye decolorizing peroxidase [Streptosporangium becharense]|uniref:Dye decolorizing peroxidase n=1 Tax=Streptosporangium becharense TaxID=1816182 RepID=A0A7W9IMN5_9ACTN|nr:Dyp-type peroxidase [Streptosporangium becharense]MBB2910195.1 dye decolorizing peroxidase [Streptosporangium becharense]MBB5822938.1 dye decolorizing peroxidase [Streptosporangium becharense]